jgi:hypothetical protein
VNSTDPRVRGWRLLIAASAATGVALAAWQYDVWWTALSQLASLAVAASYAVLAFREPRSPWLRGALTSTMVLVAIAFLAMQHGNLWDPYSVFEHMLTPALVLADFVLVGTNQARVRWWHPPTWLLPSAAYLVWYVAADLGVYLPLDLGRPTAFALNTALLGALLLGAGFALYDIGRRRRAALA